ncbi:hypothetical protein X801_08031, partial [Opisthorchis viverrini]
MNAGRWTRGSYGSHCEFNRARRMPTSLPQENFYRIKKTDERDNVGRNLEYELIMLTFNSHAPVPYGLSGTLYCDQQALKDQLGCDLNW